MSKKAKIGVVLVGVLLCLFVVLRINTSVPDQQDVSPTVVSDNPQVKTDDFVQSILLEMDKRMNPDALLEVRMDVYDKTEESSYIFSMKAKNNNQYLLLRYQSPERWENTNMLMIKEDIWIYDRGADRFMQVPRNLAFGGTDVAHGDMMRLNISANYSGEIIEENEQQWVLHLKSTHKNVAYHGIDITIDKEGYYPIVAQCFSKSGKHIKSIEYSDVKELNGIKKPTTYTFLSPYEPDNYNVITILNETLKTYDDALFNIWAMRDGMDE